MNSTSPLFTLTHIVLPSSDSLEYDELLVRRQENKLYFNTWMNVFAAQKYAQYCDLGEIYFSLTARGAYRLEIIGSKRETDKAPVDDVLVSTELHDDACVHIPNATAYEGLYFSIIQNPAEPVNLISGTWCTDKAPQRQNKLAIVSCTFKKEEYITRNVAIYEQFLKETPEIQNRIKLFVVDNGKTLPDSIKSDNVELYYNMNAGGAGGFTRGLMEVRKRNEGYTRVLFMDDDVEVFPESFYRTLIMADYLKPAYKQAFINGAMLDLYEKAQFFENQAYRWGMWTRAVHPPCEMTYENILKVNNIPEDIFHRPLQQTHGAWWYCCFDIEIVNNKGLPLPLFLRGDDLEWGWRNYGQIHITMNGICIWHAPFQYRVSKTADFYYLPRNMFLLNILYTSDFHQWWKADFTNTLKYLCRTYNYTGLALFEMALLDILKGDKAFRENPEDQLKRINKANELSCVKQCTDEEELQKAMSPRPYKIKKWRRVVSRFTKRGKYCPNIFKKKERSIPDWLPPVEAFTMVKNVNLYNPLKKQYEIRQFDFAKDKKYSQSISQLINQIEKKFDELSATLNTAHRELTSEGFWKQYLELEN
ncbi:MAG: glycosyltransferase family 2 protein [Akkermansia sp.]|nr:glycosyltransferase family 2 protein [Akkermansia sp.]